MGRKHNSITQMKSCQRIVGTWGHGIFMATIVHHPLPLLAEFQPDPKAWLAANLNPRDYKTTNFGGEFESRATPDWSKWRPVDK